jgi:FkbM family methyltransferase
MYSDNSFFYKLYKKKYIPEKLYLFYNIYIRNIKYFLLLNEKNTQFGEEKEIKKILNINKVGNFVDIGCFHPTRQNNTYELYRAGWKGINIDLNPLSIKLFNFARPYDDNICTAISNKEGYKKLYFLGDLDTKNTIEKNQLNLLNKEFGIKKTKIKKIKVKKLNNILERNKFYKIDFLNIDTEGSEYQILKTINFKRYNIKLICIEILTHNKQSIIKNKKTINLLLKNKFKLIKKIGVNYLFLKEKW